ncbi:bifunctional diaminohydroxyphosphoribosylaminopyrimidine deaminase/5-amino-6-(5-phosphoribosylamino)uracil reductase RibD [Candidatus Peribacteria bacterium]|nr:bifunctional diaminohydroxyphosphoribosylaminopyrimidine deaminase/5-amino-6-(5-phosphoribosylamino)uracil reductase RibD [Candidatus Peribacteria bacterium]
MNHEWYMHRCLKLAQQGRGLVGGNPLVGAVLVREDQIISEGYYRGAGTDHAEVDAIKHFVAASQWDAATLYVNLEPCNHQGETPPCTRAIIESGIKHVIVGMVDPDERVAGKGIAALREAGITVEGPVCRAECERLNRGYISLRTKGRPYITLKKAQTVDGRVANADGSKLCITSPDQNTWSHTYLRATYDAILIGVGTVITDNPQLTIRYTNHESPITNHQLVKIILDPHLRIPLDAKVVGEGTIVVKEAKEAEDSEEAKEKKLREKGATVIAVPMVDNHFDWTQLWNTLSALSSQPCLAGRQVSALLVEGGPTTWDAFKKAGLVDEEIILIGT